MQQNIHSPGLSLPSQSIQNHIHELAKTLPPPRKQNIACDACRSRKVKCNRIPGNDKCQHCRSKNYPCTNYVQQATAKKRHTNTGRRPRALSTSGSTDSLSAVSPPREPAPPLPLSVAQNLLSHPVQTFRQSLYPAINRETPTVQLLAHLFSPPDTCSRGSPASYSDWGDEAVKLSEESFRNDLALDLVEVFFQIVHTRFPLLNPTQFRSRLGIPSPNNQFYQQSTQSKPLHPALVATILAFGAKFAENQIFVADRARNGGTQSFFATTLIHRARDLAEALKVHRVASAEHVVISLLLECLQSQTPDDPSGFHRFWLGSSIRCLLDLQINHKSVMANIQDPEDRGTMIFAWWMAVLSDAYSSAYYRKKPLLDDDDYDIDFYTAEPVSPEAIEGQQVPSSREQLEFLGYYRAAHAQARIARQISKQFWKPVVEADGIPVDTLTNLMQSLYEWKDQFLAKVGVPSNFQAEWDFMSAISACASDATYHIMWIIIFNALDDFGVKEVNEITRNGSPTGNPAVPQHIEDLKKKVLDEALHGALRIAGLTGVLASNGYLRLDPAVMMASCTHSGLLLARLGRPEVSNCISGLQQYSFAYEEAAEQANEMTRIFRSGDGELGHMASVVPRASSATPSPLNVGVGLPGHVANGPGVNGHEEMIF